MTDDLSDKEPVRCSCCGKNVICWPAAAEGDLIRYRPPSCACGPKTALTGYFLFGPQGAPLLVYSRRSQTRTETG